MTSMTKAAQGQINNFAVLAQRISKTLGEIDVEEEKKKHLDEDGDKIKSIKDKLKSFFSVST